MEVKSDVVHTFLQYGKGILKNSMSNTYLHNDEYETGTLEFCLKNLHMQMQMQKTEFKKGELLEVDGRNKGYLCTTQTTHLILGQKKKEVEQSKTF